MSGPAHQRHEGGTGEEFSVDRVVDEQFGSERECLASIPAVLDAVDDLGKSHSPAHLSSCSM